jgi:acyl-CoA thioesterase YciA
LSFVTEPFNLFPITANRETQTMAGTQTQPCGEVLLRTLAMPSDTNPNGVIKPVKVGDVVCCYGELVRIGNTSITVRLEIWVNPILRGNPDKAERFKVTEATFTYVAVDDNGNKRPLRQD